MTKMEYRVTPYLTRRGDRLRLVYHSKGANARRWLELEPADAISAWAEGRESFIAYVEGKAFAGEAEEVRRTLSEWSLTPTMMHRAWGRGKTAPKGLHVWLTRKKGDWGGHREAKEWPEALKAWWEAYVQRAVETHSLGWYLSFADAYEGIMGRPAPRRLEEEFGKETLERQRDLKV